MTETVTVYRADGTVRDLASSDDAAALDRFLQHYTAQGFRCVRVDVTAELAKREANLASTPPRWRPVLPGVEEPESYDGV